MFMRLLKKIKICRDPRVNVPYVSIKEYVVLFLVFLVFNRINSWLFQYFDTPRIHPFELPFGRALIFLLFVTTFITTLIGVIRHRSWNRPIRKLSDAARKIAGGDFSVRITPLRKDGKKDHIEVMFDDFNTMAQELQGIEMLKNDFIGNVSHEIKTPLAVIQSYATAMQDDNLEPEKRREYIETIISASHKLSTLVSNILKLNKLENQEILPEAKPFDLGEQLRQCAVAFVDSWEKKNIEFEAELDDVIVCSDENVLEIVWNNLISNAIKFTDPYGSINIKLTEKDGYAYVSISNTGAGMDEETRRRVFDKFYQGDTSHHQEGNGLGLALVKRAVDLVGGTVSVESRPGEGATFTVSLKAADVGVDEIDHVMDRR